MVTEITEDPKTALKGKDAAVVAFYADWCGDCKRSLEYEKALSEELKGSVEFFRMDAEEYEPIADTYGVDRYPTYVFFRKGKAVKGLLLEPDSKESLKRWVEQSARSK